MDHPAGQPNSNSSSSNSCPQQLPSTSSAASGPGANSSPKRMRLTAPPSPPSPPSPLSSALANVGTPSPTLPRCCLQQRSFGTALQPHRIRQPPAVTINRYSEACEDHILEWQENQISHSIIENTVNRVVESYNSGLDELYAEIEDQDRVVGDPAYPPYGEGEAEAIRVAIAGRGLHPPQEMLRSLSQLCSAPGMGSLSSDDDDADDDDVEQEETHHYDGLLCGREHPLGDGDEGGPRTGAGDSNDAEHFQFMEAAVAVAIQKKGLAPSNSSSSASSSSTEADASSGPAQVNGGGEGDGGAEVAVGETVKVASQPG